MGILVYLFHNYSKMIFATMGWRICIFAIIFQSSINCQSYFFTENKGQWPKNVLFQSPIRGATMYIEKDRLSFDVIEFNDHSMEKDHKHNTSHGIASRQVYQMIFDQALPYPSARGEEKSRYYKNYFIGSDKSTWASRVYDYNKVEVQNIFPCTDMVFYTEEQALKYDYVIAPGGSLSNITWHYEGASDVALRNGQIQIKTINNLAIESIPEAYQIIDGQKKTVLVNYVRLEDDKYGFDLQTNYNKAYPLVIDPKLVFSTYSGSTSDNWGSTATYDSAKNGIGGGYSAGTGYPTTTGVFDTTYSGDWDLAITKFGDDGTNLIFSTYIGGSLGELPKSMISDSQDNLLIVGTTGSSNFPTTSGVIDNSFNGGSGAFPNSLDYPNGTDIFVAKLSADGTELLASTFIGGSGNDGLNDNFALSYNYGDQSRGEIMVDGNDNVYVASCTSSSNFPTTAAWQNTYGGGGQDGVLFKLAPNLENIIFSTYVGGDELDAGYSVKLDSNGNIFMCGGTVGGDFNMPSGGLNPSYIGGQSDGFVLKFDVNGNAIAGTYIGTNSYDQSYFVEIDKFNDVYLYGQTNGNYPVTAGTYNNPNTNQFIHKLNGELDSSLFSTVFGAGTNAINISPTAFLVDACQRIYVAGWGGSLNGVANNGTTNMEVSADAYQTSTDGQDFYLAVFEEDMESLVYATFFGRNSSGGAADHVDGGTSRFDSRGAAYQAVCAGCWGLDDFPTTPNAWSTTNGSNLCNMAVFKFDFELGFPEANPSFLPNEVVDSLQGCIDPVTGVYSQFFYQYNLDFSNLGAQEFFWDFGVPNTEEDQSTFPTPIYNFETAGLYTARLIVQDTTKCIPTDTAYIVIEVIEPDPLTANFTYELASPCSGSNLVSFDMSSSIITGTEYSYAWDLFGGGNFNNLPTGQFEFGGPGSYEVSLVIRDSLPCFNTDTITQTIIITALNDVEASFDPPLNGCAPQPLILSASPTLNGSEFEWLLNGELIAETQTHQVSIAEPGDYEIMLITENINSCNQIDSLAFEFQVYANPDISFSYVPTSIYIGDNVSFTPAISGVTDYTINWQFGDGTSSNENNPSHIYVSKTTFTVCMEVINNLGGCSDTYCEDINVDAAYYLEVPNAFSPNGDMINDVFKPEILGITTYSLQIFNRWGQKVFETNDVTAGWDGTYNKKEQELDVYVYHIEAIAISGDKIDKKGNLTLIK